MQPRLLLLALAAPASVAAGRPVIGIYPAAGSPAPVAAGRPVIGIYPAGDSYGMYEKWLQQEGADYVMLPKDFSGSKLEELFQSINGFLITGGGDPFGTSVDAMVARAVKANEEEGDYFPVWGTCLGFEWLVDIFAGYGSITDGFDSESLALPLNFTPAAATSRIYGGNATLLEWLGKEAITWNLHHEGITPERAQSRSSSFLTKFDILATDVDRKGKGFVAQIEGKTLPIYAQQFHPERIQFSSGRGVPKSAHAVAAARHLAQFFVSEARKNKHKTS